MELIIKIPDEDYKFIKDFESITIGGRGCGKTIQQNVINAIKSGTPYNPSGDLISRSALKTELEVYRHTRNYKSDEDEAQNALLDNILEDIDNAQAVERSKDECVVEWETTVHGLLAYKVCGGCKAEYLFDLTYGWKLCPKCGAKIKGGAE